MCESENAEGSRFCSMCGGTFTAHGVDYSLGPTVPEWYEDADGEEADDGDDTGPNPAAGMYLMFYLIMTACLSSTFLAEGYSEGNNGMFFTGLFFLGAFALCLFALWRYITIVYSEPSDSSHRLLTHEDGDEIYSEVTKLMPRR